MVPSCGSQATVGILAQLHGVNAAVLSQIRVLRLLDTWTQPHKPYGDMSYFSGHPAGGISFCFSLAKTVTWIKKMSPEPTSA